jgi:hypothetical protein
MTANDRISDGVKIATGVESERSPSAEVPEEFMFLDEQERVQGLTLRRLFAEQEHRLRQKYADWIILAAGSAVCDR